MSEICEYNPLKDRAAYTDEEGACPNEATVSTSSGAWHLCESCSKLPRFKRFKFHPLRLKENKQ